MPQPLPLLKRQRIELAGVSLQPTRLLAALAASLHPREAFCPLGMEVTPVGGFFSQSLQEGLEMQCCCCWVLFLHLEGFKCHLVALLCPDGSSEELIMGDPLPSWKLWVGKTRLLVSMQLPT